MHVNLKDDLYTKVCIIELNKSCVEFGLLNTENLNVQGPRLGPGPGLLAAS